MQTYRYAYNLRHEEVDVRFLVEPEKVYNCLGCGNELIAVIKGVQKDKHFRHRHIVDCNGETYLHKLAKTTFFKVYNECLVNSLAFYLETQHEVVCPKRLAHNESCVLAHRLNRSDLTKKFDRIALEQRDGQFIPDILLYNDTDLQDKCYIEFAVTHILSEAKRNSIYKIIEIDVFSEKDIEPIRERFLNCLGARFVNLKLKPIVKEIGKCPCEENAKRLAARQAQAEQAAAAREAKAKQKVLAQEAKLKKNTEFYRELELKTERRIAQLREEQAQLRVRNLAATATLNKMHRDELDLPEECIFHTSRCEIWLEPQNGIEAFTVYDGKRKVEGFSTKEEAYYYCADSRLI